MNPLHLAKVASIERGVARAREEFSAAGGDFTPQKTVYVEAESR